MRRLPRWATVAVSVAIAACAPRATPAPAPTKTPAPAPAPAHHDPCSEEGTKEAECTLPDGRHGWCGVGKCEDICGPDATYTHLSSTCVKPCGAGCRTCDRDFGLCTDESPYGTEVRPLSR